MTPPLSSNPLNVAARTLTGSNASYSLKAAETASRCAHTGQGGKRATEASRGVWRVISAAYGLGNNRSRRNGLYHLAREGRHHLARTSEHHKLAHTPSIIQGHTLSIIQDCASEHHLARESEHHLPTSTSKHHKLEGVSLHHSAAAQVSIANPGTQFFILKTANPPMIRGLYGKQFFIPRTIRIAYSIRDTYGSAPNDKLRL